MKHATIFALALTTSLGTGVLVPFAIAAPAPPFVLVQTDNLNFDGGKAVKAAPEAKVPTPVRRALPKGAKTLLYVSARLEGKAVTLHLWNPAKGESCLDVLQTRSTRGKGKRRTVSTQRLKRITFGPIEPNFIALRAAPLDARGKSGSVIALNWTEPQSMGAFSTVPMLAIVLPGGLNGAPVFQGLETESSSSGNVFHQLRVGKDGRAFSLLTSESFDGGTQDLERFEWNGREFAKQGEGVRRPLPAD